MVRGSGISCQCDITAQRACGRVPPNACALVKIDACALSQLLIIIIKKPGAISRPGLEVETIAAALALLENKPICSPHLKLYNWFELAAIWPWTFLQHWSHNQ